jgi:hypothetical protein
MSKSYKEQMRDRFQDKRDAKKVKYALAKKLNKRDDSRRWDRAAPLDV